MHPTVVEISPDANVVKEELFGPVLYVMKFMVSTNSYFYYLSESRQLSYTTVHLVCNLCRL